MILAAGKGKRLRPLTDSIPKTMVPIGDKPLLEHVVRLPSSHGFAELVINLHHLPEVIVVRWLKLVLDDDQSALIVLRDKIRTERTDSLLACPHRQLETQCLPENVHVLLKPYGKVGVFTLP